MIKSIGIFLLFVSVTFAETLQVASPASNPQVGDAFTIDVNIAGVTDLYAFQFDLNFDPTLLEAVSVTEGAFLPSGGTTFFVPGTIDNVGGDVSANSDTLIGAIPGVSGDGTLAEFQFIALSPGTSTVSFDNNILLDSSLNDVTTDATFDDGSVTIDASSAVPEPKTFAFFTTGLLLLLFEAHRRARQSSNPPKLESTALRTE